MIETIIEKCKALKLKAFAQELQQVIEMAARKTWPPLQCIEHLLDPAGFSRGILARGLWPLAVVVDRKLHVGCDLDGSDTKHI